MKMQDLAFKLHMLCLPVQCERERLRGFRKLELDAYLNWGGMKQGIQEKEGVNYFKAFAAMFLLI